MDRALPRTIDIPRWQFVAITFTLLFSVGVAVETFVHMLWHHRAVDWELFVLAGEAIRSGQNPYSVEVGELAFRWSPVTAWTFALIAPIGLAGWMALHFAALPLFGSWWMALVIGTSWPFWDDLNGGNAMIFSGLIAFWAWRGNRPAGWAYLAMCLLIPRPLFLPLLVWLLWKRPRLRWPFVGLFVAHALLVAVIGWGPEWIARLTESGGDMVSGWNFAPSRWIGWWWMLAAVPLAVWLTWKGRIGLASLAASPYIFPFYGLMLVLEATRPPAAAPAESASARPARRTSSGPDQRPSAP